MLGTSTSKRLLKITVIAAYSANLSSAFTNSFPSHPSLGVTTIPKKNDKYLRMSQEGAEPIEQTTIARLEKGLTEMNRRDRRDFFNADKWVQHRASDRFLENLIRIPFSRVVWMIFKEVSIISLISWLLVAYNHLFVLGYTDLFEGTYYPPITDMQFPLLTLPKEPFILSSPALSFMLVFLTNSCWNRWDEARKAWGVIVNNCRSIARKTSSWIMESDMPYEEKQKLLVRIADAVWAFPRAEQRHLLSGYEDEIQFQLDIRRKVHEPFASDVIRIIRHRPSFVLFELSCALNELPLDLFRRNQIDEAVSQLCDAMGECDRLYYSPIPKVYFRHSSRFLFLWLAFMPLALWEPLSVSLNHFLLPVVSSSIALAMMGIIQIAIIIEEPFSVLPLKKITDGIDKSAQEHLEYNAWEHDNRPQSITSRIYQDYLSEDYASQEYLEAMSKDTVIRHRELNNWSPPASTIRPAQFEREPPAAYAEQQQYTTKPMLEVEQPPPEESYATSYTEYAEPYLSPQQQQQIQQPQEIAPPPQQYSPPYNPPQQYSPPYNPPQQYSPPYDPPQQYSPPYNPPPQEQVSYQSTPTSTEFDAQQSQNINVEEEEEGYSNLSPMERLERMKLNVLREINDSLRDCNDNDRNSKR